jgi:hypothetical protein
MVYLTFNTIIASFSLIITRDRDVFFSCPIKIKAFFVVFSAFIFIPVRAVDRFFTVFSAFAKSLV